MLVDDLLEKINEHPEECKVTRFRFYIGKRIVFWTANGFPFFCPDDCVLPEDAFGLIDRWRIWRAYKRWLKGVPLTHLEGETA